MQQQSLMVSGLGVTSRWVDRTVANVEDFVEFMAERPQAFVAEIKKGKSAPLRARSDFVRLFVQSAARLAMVNSFSVTQGASVRQLYEKVLIEANGKRADQTVWITQKLMNHGLHEEVDRLIASFVAKEAKPAPKVTPERAGAAFRDQLLKNEKWLDSKDVHQLLGLAEDSSNYAQTANRLRNDRKIFGVKHAGKCWHPRAQFDLDNCRVWPVVQELLTVLPRESSGWRNLFWLFEPRKSLGGKRPADVLGTRPEEVLKVAREAFEGSDASW
jgi:hypothetical protein